MLSAPISVIWTGSTPISGVFALAHSPPSAQARSW
jgi:hypothetical protein